MNSLPQILDRFNRKERNLLVHHALGYGTSPLQLSRLFLTQVSTKLGISLPDDAWWSTDYHLDWLAGALAMFLSPESQQFLNSPHLVEGKNEDVDFVIATDEHLILIEVKAYSPFTSAQIESKRDRLNALFDFCQTLASTSPRRVTLHFLDLSSNPQAQTCRPKFATEGAWIELVLPDPANLFEVTRCDKYGNSSADGTYWRWRTCGAGRRKRSTSTGM